MRREDWPEQLAAAVKEAETKPFQWGEHDCCLFAADIVLAMTGEDPAVAFRGRYRTATGAKRALTRYGRGSVPATVDALFGARHRPQMARRGDLLLAATAQGEAVGVCVGPHGVFAAPAGLTRVPLADCLCSWRVD